VRVVSRPAAVHVGHLGGSGEADRPMAASRYRRVAPGALRLAGRLDRTWDGRWREVRPCEIDPALGYSGTVFRVWKRNWLDSVTSYDLDYGSFSRNRELDSANNHLTAGWVAFSDRRRGRRSARPTGCGGQGSRWARPSGASVQCPCACVFS
jgi:hypothetical protein